MSDQSQKVLEEIRKTKSNLLKQGAAAALGINFTNPQIGIPVNHFVPPVSSTPAGGGFPEVHMSPVQRSAMQSLQQANATSFGFFISQDSHFGNAILPVLPRFDSAAKLFKFRMKLKELERWLSQCDQFESPKIVYEQYATSAHIAARMIYAGQDDIEGSAVCDLGSGCGVLSIGSALAGAGYVCGIEIDSDAIEIATQNYQDMFEEESETPIDFINAAIDLKSTSSTDHLTRFSSSFDVVVMNPPFGTKNNAGADYKFLKQAISLVRPGGSIYSLHKSSTREFFNKQMASATENLEVSGEVLAQVRYDLPKCYKFHKEKSVDIAVDFWRFEKLAVT